MTIGKRIACIFHLCLGFIALLWIVLYPFLGSIYYYKSEMQLFETIIKRKELFEDLPNPAKTSFLSKFDRLKALSCTPKAKEAARILLSISPYSYIWVILSIAVPVLFLLQVEGSTQIAWLLPFICLLMVFSQSEKSETKRFSYPSETYLRQTYIKETLAETIQGQYEQLKRGWEMYLIREHAHETPSQDIAIYRKQREKGEFHFNISALNSAPVCSFAESQSKSSSRFLLVLSLIWNAIFAFYIGYQPNQEKFRPAEP